MPHAGRTDPSQDATRGPRARHDRASVPAFWTVVDGRVVAGPWADRYDAVRAGDDHPGSAVGYGVVAADGTLTSRSAPDDLAFNRLWSEQVARLTDDHGGRVRATRDATALLTVRVARALVLAGVPVADTTGREATGGVLLVPVRTGAYRGVALGWATHPRMATIPTANRPVPAGVGDVLTYAVAATLDALGFTVRYGRQTRAHLVTAGPGDAR
ncbi:hypothetical protein E0F15_23085 [Frankia sp. B2]|uniref:Uncharacterized protein n=1 Tax=Frankia casuarinae (strain DSM 45818 / CECT 9043 / HFP020203 / CcI3) TaxID=106370 RepID=Q2JGQ8_FRACC|nr:MULTISPECIES: hypothetical protein [Frankia]ABD09534.1 hypothetical protein Francci3_0140 [Frankia casuarinae]TFE23610.1 hypothetical protein E0F15_23085 [Frankia sp. B2]